MHSSEFIKMLSVTLDIAEHKTQDMIKVIGVAIREYIRTKGKLLIEGFGSLTLTNTSASQINNPNTGEIVILPNQSVITFQQSKSLKNKINNIDDQESPQTYIFPGDLIDDLKNKSPELSKETSKILDITFSNIARTIVLGNEAFIEELGLFKIYNRPQLQAKNPRTGELVTLPSKKSVVFSDSTIFPMTQHPYSKTSV